MIEKRISIRVLPRSSKNEVVGEMDNGVLKVKLTAAPVDGDANKALILVLSKYFQVSKSSVTLVKGHKSKDKVVMISMQ
ncbi:MAG: DUF167 domain-containing protein [Candidatus Magasanikbacteria bacterium]|uniref:UPF0235 protein COU30_01555 n=1 Tax=Candidatus Magasanikbacteria bacterium CG10_big_fil_rev_8_21_14_0_10_38_6 TaxID=1974647 RepID=A0A2M6P1M4_9BACT|nr:DUF167 domain-containing protein [Candidatus Magasanikbacteria bacterium]NCS72054.1 DUF167 domain-containing protein [Candidatus Magasanikbacteria bacterium]PIR77601.1 MAG: hypothetical protein COU30_01555 [Candidatus Magasanikbacteria bacterium CG10_big_fil_rev_8_21_14_0_10_38_6]